MSRIDYFVRRLALAFVVFFGVLLITFSVSYIVPGDPARLYLGSRATPERLEAVREELGLNDSLPEQFIRYVTRTMSGDLGVSLRTKRLILDDIKIRLPATMELVIAAMFLAIFIGVPIGVLSAAQRGRIFDQLIRIITIGGVSIPSFWLALLLQLLFFLHLDWLPLGGRISLDVMLNHPIEIITGFYMIDSAITGNWIAFRDVILHMILPVSVLATYPISLAVRMTRASMVDVLSETYITSARAAGLTEKEILFKLGLKNGIVPTLTVMGLLFAYSITGAILIEIVFTWPGMGEYMAEAILNNDIYVLFGVTLVVTFIYISINLFSDFLQTALDPRIRVSEREDA